MRYCQILCFNCVLLLLLAAAGTVSAQDSVTIAIEAALEDAWQIAGDGDDCRLEQQLNGYGVARFLGVRGGGLQFELIGHRDLFAEGPVEVYQSTPEWHRHHPTRGLLGQALHVAGGSIATSDPLATRILLSLFEGYDISLTRDSWFAEGKQVGVKLTSVGLRDNYSAFTGCFRGALLRSWAEVERTRIGFAPAAWQLDEAASQRLDELAEYLARDPSVVEVFIDGHTDDSGSVQANLDLAQRRAQAIAGYLADAGVAREKLVVRFHGARYPVADNDSEPGRAQNRRATIRLERNWSALVSR